MPQDRDIAGCCDNDKRYPERMIIYSNVKGGKIFFHKLSINEERQKAWIFAVSKGKEDFEKPKRFKVCSNNFFEEKRTKCNPDPTLFLKY